MVRQKVKIDMVIIASVIITPHQLLLCGYVIKLTLTANTSKYLITDEMQLINFLQPFSY